MLSLDLMIVYIICFLSLFFAFIWISTLSIVRKELVDVREIKEYPFVSMIVPAWNEEEMIGETINSLLEVDYPKNKFEIIVVANNCTDKTANVVRAFKDRRVKLMEVSWDKNQFINNKSHAENLALAKAKGEIIGIMDADTIVAPNIFKLMVPYFQDEKVGAVISTVKVRQPKNFLEKIQWIEFIVGNLLKRLMSSIGVFFITSGACNLYKKDILAKLGNFSEDTITEDAELATRLLYNKYKVLSQMEAVVYARAAKTMRAFYTQRLRWNRGLLLIMAKYRGIIFNKKYGALGYIFPLYMSMFGLLVTIDILLFINVARLLANAYNWIVNDIIYFVYPWDYIRGNIVGMDMYFLIPSLVILLCGVYMLIRAHKYLKEKWKYPLATIIFLTAYQMAMAMFWLLAVVYEITGTKKAWRGKTRW